MKNVIAEYGVPSTLAGTPSTPGIKLTNRANTLAGTPGTLANGQIGQIGQMP